MNKPKPKTITGEAYPDLAEYFKPINNPEPSTQAAYMLAAGEAIRRDYDNGQKAVDHAREQLANARATVNRCEAITAETERKHKLATERDDELQALREEYQPECDKCPEVATTGHHADNGECVAIYCDAHAAETMDACRIKLQDPPSFPHDQPADALDLDDTRPGCDS